MPGFTLHRGARIEALADRLVDELRGAPPEDALAPVTVSVGSRGMERWLRNHLASSLPICANVVFPFPGQALARIYGDAAERPDPWRPDALAWRILGVLPGMIDLDTFAPLRTWLHRTGRDGEAPPVGRVTRNAWSLAREVADVLDRAALFRPDWTLAWEIGVMTPDAPAWQAHLWRTLHGAIGEDHPTRRFTGVPRAGDPLHVFAVSSLPPLWLEALARAGTRRSVHVYLLTPSQEYWGDTRTRRQLARLGAERAREALDQQNPLLTAFGAVARDTTEAYLQVPDVTESDLSGAFEVQNPQTALGVLQSDIVAARTRAELSDERDARPLDPRDDSIQVHACHGPTRQAEALREALLDLFDRHPDLEPRDVVVMTPDLGTYAPVLRTVLAEGSDTRGDDGWGPTGGPRIPTYVADLGVRELNPLADMLLRALALVDRPLTAPTLADFVALDPVRRTFGLEDADLARVRGWLHDAGARHGADAQDRARSGLPPQHAFTLAFALDRLALGTTLDDDGLAAFHGIAPLDGMEGDAGRAFGAFAELCARLDAWRHRLRAPRPMDAWVETLGRFVDDLGKAPPGATSCRSDLFDGLSALADEAAPFDGDVDTDAIVRILQSRFESAAPGERPTTGAVTVCALAPMRSVPFRVVCLLGMDDGAFPRVHAPRAFDAVATRRRPGDRDPREEDRNLLLEALLSARSHLLVFYTGRDPQSDRLLAPAVPVGDLLDTIDATFRAPGDASVAARDLVTRVHAVQPFSSSGFRPAGEHAARPRPARFDARMYAAAMQLAGSRHGAMPFAAPGDVLPEGAPPAGLTLDALVRWVRTPVRTLVRERLGLYLDDRVLELPDREPFELHGVAPWTIGNAMANAWMRGAVDRDTVVERLALRGMLPPGAPGRAAGHAMWQRVAAAGALLADLLGGRREPPLPREVHAAVTVGDGRLVVTGRAETRGDVLVRFGHDDPNTSRALLSAWVHLLAVRASGHEVSTAHVVGASLRNDLPCGVVISLHVPSADEARAHLADLAALALEARRSPLPLVDKTTFAWASRALGADVDTLAGTKRQKVLEDARTAARSAWSTRAGAAPGESSDPALALVFAQAPPYGPDPYHFSAAFEQAGTRLWRPLLSARRTP